MGLGKLQFPECRWGIPVLSKHFRPECMLGFVVLCHLVGAGERPLAGHLVHRGQSLVILRPQRLRENSRKKQKLRDWERQRLGAADRQTNENFCWPDSSEKQWRIRLGWVWVGGRQAEGTGCAQSSGVTPRRWGLPVLEGGG